jgi:hypothetical protein
MGLRTCLTLHASVMRTLTAAPSLVTSRTSCGGSNVRSPCALPGRRALRRVLAADRQPPCQTPHFHCATWNRQAALWRCTVTAAAPASSTAPAEALSSTQQQQIDVFVDFLLEENAKYNLTGMQACYRCHPQAAIQLYACARPLVRRLSRDQRDGNAPQVPRMQRRCRGTCATAWRCCRCWMLPPPLAVRQPAHREAAPQEAIQGSWKRLHLLSRPTDQTQQRRIGPCACWMWAPAPGCRACCWPSAARTGR